MALAEMIDLPIMAAPMAGVSTPVLVATVSEVGGLGNLAAGYAPATALARDIAAVREFTEQPFGVNVFVPSVLDRQRYEAEVAAFHDRIADSEHAFGVPGTEPDWTDDFDYRAKIELLVATGPAVVSFTFGCPEPAVVQRLRGARSQVVVTVTQLDEARRAAAAGADAICVQSYAAGGHRATFDQREQPNEIALEALLRDCREVGLPMIAAGALMSAEDIAQARNDGAMMAQCGTAYLLADEAGTSRPYRRALTEPGRESQLIRSFSGRVARGLGNDWTARYEAGAPSAFPVVDQLTKPIRAAATRADDAESISLWAGTGWQAAQAEPAEVITRRLAG